MRKFIIGLIVTLLPLSILLNTTYAEPQTDLKKQVKPNTKTKAIKTWHRIQAIKQKTKKLNNQQSPSTRSSQKSPETYSIKTTSVEYKGKASNTQQNEYVFQVASPSQVQVSSMISNNQLDFLLIGMDDAGSVSFYQDGDTLPAGEYSFIVFADNESLINYHYVLSGIPFAEQPNTELPQLTFTNPSFPISRLPQNTSNILFSGTTDTSTFVTNNEGFSQTFQGDFNFSVPLRDGNNYVDFQAITDSGNATYINLSLIVPAMKRIDGKDRYVVAANVAKDMPPSNTIILASGLEGKFADALSGSSLAGLYQAPILMTLQNELPSATVQEIKRRGPTQAIIMGGVGTIDPAIENELKNLGIQSIKRMGGPNRFAVSVNTANHLKSILGPQMRDGVLVASGMVFPDALSISTVASDSVTPILLVSHKEVPTEAASFMQSNPNINQITTVGGSVPQAAITKLKTFGQVTSIHGSDRYAVNLNVAKVFGVDVRYLVFAVGTKFSDALSGGPFASSLAPTLSPLFLTPTHQLPTVLKTYLDNRQVNIQVIYILGGVDSVSENVANQLNTYVQ